MAPVTNTRVLFNSIPKGYPEPGKTTVTDTSQKIDPDTVPLNGGILVKLLYVSVDPYQRGRMREEGTESYVSAFKLGEPIDNYAVGIVVRSEVKGFEKGVHVYGMLPYENYTLVPASAASHLRILDNKFNLPWSVYVGVAGMPGKTAYMAWKEYSHVKEGETVFVSGGAGPVGSLVIQLAKLAKARVIASAGSDEKVAFMKSCGADVVFNYKKENTLEVLKREGGIDIYWDNVGGETLDAALEAAKVHGRFIECGMISGYNTGGAVNKNLFHGVSKSLSINGFIVYRLHPKYETEFYNEIPKLLSEGKLKYHEHIYEGLESAGDAILAVQKGTNKGKAVVKVADEFRTGSEVSRN